MTPKLLQSLGLQQCLTLFELLQKKIVIDPMASTQQIRFCQFVRAEKLKMKAPADLAW